MEPTGFGSWRRRVVLNVDTLQAAAFAEKLGGAVGEQKADGATTAVIWKNVTSHPHGDERVVWDLFELLGAMAESVSWSIDWSDSLEDDRPRTPR